VELRGLRQISPSKVVNPTGTVTSGGVRPAAASAAATT